MSFNQPFSYDPNTGRWHLELHKAPKMLSAQCGLKISIDTGTPTGDTGAFYSAEDSPGLKNSKLEIRYFDNLSGYVSTAVFDLPTLISKLIEIMPKDKIYTDTYCLSDMDRKATGEL